MRIYSSFVGYAQAGMPARTARGTRALRSASLWLAVPPSVPAAPAFSVTDGLMSLKP
jgi:hypothetical protein